MRATVGLAAEVRDVDGDAAARARATRTHSAKTSRSISRYSSVTARDVAFAERQLIALPL